MNIDVYDTSVRTADGSVLHFDVLLPSGDASRARQYAYEWLLSMGMIPEHMALEQCLYRHSETANPLLQQRIRQSGYYIIPMGGCPGTAG